jgi:hypothetical protein
VKACRDSHAVKALSDYRLNVRFDDRTEGEIALGDRLFGPVFEPLQSTRRASRWWIFLDAIRRSAWRWSMSEGECGIRNSECGVRNEG